MAAFCMRLFFMVAVFMAAIVLGMWFGLQAVEGYKMEPRHKIINVEANQTWNI